MTTFSLSAITSETTLSIAYISCIVIAEHQPHSAEMLAFKRKHAHLKLCQRRGERDKVTSKRSRIKVTKKRSRCRSCWMGYPNRGRGDQCLPELWKSTLSRRSLDGRPAGLSGLRFSSGQSSQPHHHSPVGTIPPATLAMACWFSDRGDPDCSRHGLSS